MTDARCPSCGATNPPGAAWCGQCFTRFEPAAAPAPTAAPAPPRHPHASPPSTAPARAPGTAGAAAGDRRLRVVDGGVEWTCATCGEANPIDTFSCTVCGAGMADAFAPPSAPVDWDRARRRELLVPGSGLVLAGAGGLGAARAVLVGLWLLGALLLLASGGAEALPIAAPLLVGVTALYATGVRDVDALRAGREPLWAGRRLLWLVIAVTLLPLLIGVVLALGGTPGGSAAGA